MDTARLWKLVEEHDAELRRLRIDQDDLRRETLVLRNCLKKHGVSPDGGDLWAGQIEMNVPGAQAHYIAACECVQSVEGVGTGDWTGGGNTDAVPYTQSQISASGKPDGGPMAPYKDDKSKKRKIRDKKLQEELNRIKKLLK